MPNGITPERAWCAVEFSRVTQLSSLPLTFWNDKQFKFWIPPQHQEWISYIDQNAGGLIGSKSSGVVDDNGRYLFNSLMEEAIASSVLEGAVATRAVAKEMLRTERQPRDIAEQMIVNNYNAILEIRDWKREKMTPALLCHLQSVLTKNTLDNPNASGRFRNENEKVDLADNDGETLFIPPPANELNRRIEELCDFANTKSNYFIHPVIKAMALHFGINFIHPFVDGNGRTGRALFYWYMLKNNYWMFEYLPISRIIISSPVQYARAYLYTETDNGDVTYFNHYHLGVVKRAIDDLHSYLRDQRSRIEAAKDLLDKFPALNLRQRLLIQEALRHPDTRCAATEHAGKYRITYTTARADLRGLVDYELFLETKTKKKEEAVFSPAPDLVKRLGSIPKVKPKKQKGIKSEDKLEMTPRQLFPPDE